MLKLLGKLEVGSLALSVLCLLVMMLVVSYDALARYALNAPLPWAFELITYYLLIFALYFAVSMTFRSGDHISIDLFRSLMPRAMRVGADVVWSLLAALIFGIIAWGAADQMFESLHRREFLPGYITWPAWVAYVGIVLGAGLTVLRLMAHAVVLVLQGKDVDVALDGEPN